MKAEVHAQDVLLAADPRTGLLDAVKTIVETVTHDKRALKAFNALLTWVDTPPMSKEARASFDKLSHHSVPAVASQPPLQSTLLVVAYLLIQRNLPLSVGQPPFFEELRRWLPNADKYVRKLEPDFAGQLLMQTEKRAAESPQFAKALAEAAKSLNAQWDSLLETTGDISEAAGIKLPQSATPHGTIAMSDTWKHILVAAAIFAVTLFGSLLGANPPKPKRA